MTPNHDPALKQAVLAALAGPYRRIQPLDLPDGRRVWLKRVERMGPVLRLQKGRPDARFAAERRGLRVLAAAGMPVVPVMMQGAGYMVLPDLGPTLDTLQDRPDTLPDTLPDTPPDTLRAFAAAGTALARLHRAGLAHGRPAVRDICWDGETARFIDLERWSPRHQGPFWQAIDVIKLVFSAHVRWPGLAGPRLDAALSAYAQAAPGGAMRRVALAARRLRGLGWLAAAMRLALPGNAELQALRVTLRQLA